LCMPNAIGCIHYEQKNASSRIDDWDAYEYSDEESPLIPFEENGRTISFIQVWEVVVRRIHTHTHLQMRLSRRFRLCLSPSEWRNLPILSVNQTQTPANGLFWRSQQSHLLLFYRKR
jgi:hypothetical protein